MKDAVQPRLLVLDDDPMVGKVLCKSAERIGALTALTSEPQEFFSQAAQWQPSHVAIDLSMPEMGGIEVLDRLAQAGCTARVIVTSGADSVRIEAALAHARALGLAVAGALPKPFFSASVLSSLLALGEPAKPANAA
jgi:CheY-like chemotaxis protein